MSGISFSTPLVRALLAGEKSQTRRIIKPCADPEIKPGDVVMSWPADQTVRTGLRFRPPYAIGDRCYVKEGIERTAEGTIAYRADGEVIPGSAWAWKPRTLPHRYMPKGLARIWLTLTDVRIERLHEITIADILAEGIRQHGRFFGPSDADWDDAALSPATAFERLWNGLHDKDGERWADNPWLVALTFTVERNANV